MTWPAFAWRNLRREWRSGELRVLIVALIVAVGSVSAVGFFTDRVGKAMEYQAGELLAADLVLESNTPLKPALLDRARELGLLTARTVSFRSVVQAKGLVKLAEVKAVGPGYPLRGHVRIASRPFGKSIVVRGLPPSGSAWAEPRLLQELGLAPGDTIRLGKEPFKINAALSFEPDRGGDLFSIAPRLMINLHDLALTGLLRTGSLATYRLLLAGPERAVHRFAAEARKQLSAGQRLVGVREARPELNSAMQRAARFLGLAAMVSVVLAGVAMAIAARRYVYRHLDGTAILRCLGATQRFVIGSYLLQLLSLGLLGSLVGILFGYLAQDVLGLFLADLFASKLPAASLWPALRGLLTGVVTLAGFALPPLLALRDVSPLRVLRRELRPVPPRTLIVYGAAVVSLFFLTYWQVGELSLTVLVLGGAMGSLIIMGTAAWILVTAVQRLGAGGISWRFGLANIARRPGASIAQVSAFGLGIMVLLLLSLVRNDLLSGWRQTLPEKAPNQFLINVLPKQVEPLHHFFSDRGHPSIHFYPMVRARLAAINGHSVSAADYDNPRAKRLVRRTFNLSWSAVQPVGTRLVAGRWWADNSPKDEWSVEQGLAQTLGISVGDRLDFLQGGQRITGTVTSLREVDWDSFRVNFFVLGTPKLLQAFPATYVASFYLPSRQARLLSDLVARFPNITVIDVEEIMQRVRTIMDRVALAVEFVFLFSLAAGFTVLYATIQSTRDERLKEAALLRTLGARSSQIVAALAAEFVTLGLLSGLLAAVAAVLTGYLLAHQVFGFEFHPGGLPWILGIVGGAVGVGVAGLLGTRQVLKQPPLWILRRP